MDVPDRGKALFDICDRLASNGFAGLYSQRLKAGKALDRGQGSIWDFPAQGQILNPC